MIHPNNSTAWQRSPFHKRIGTLMILICVAISPQLIPRTIPGWQQKPIKALDAVHHGERETATQCGVSWSRGGGYEFPLINFGFCLLGTVPAAWQTVMLLLFYNFNLHRMTPQQSSGIKLVMPRESTNTMFSRNIKSKAPHSVETKYWTSFSKFFFRKFWGFIYIYLDSCCLLGFF